MAGLDRKRRIALAAAAIVLLAAGPAQAAPRGDEPLAVERSVRQGIDFVYVDPDMGNVARRHQRPQNWLRRALSLDFGGRRSEPNPLFMQLGRGLQSYRESWGSLPQVRIPAGAAMKRGATDKRVEQLRARLRLRPGGGYDAELADAVTAYQTVHGLSPADGIAGNATIASMNRGAIHYERRIAINMERAWRLPMTRTFDRYVIVDSGAAEAYLYQRDRMADGMRVVVGSTRTKTPMMAVLMRNARANPYWNVPPDLIRNMTAKRVLDQGIGYIDQFHYEVLSDWTARGQIVDPGTINWRQVAAGKRDIRVRQTPGPWNSMGAMKFEMPNDYGIYLHDTPHKELFGQKDRLLSNGCVRLEDYRRFASWVFGRMPETSGQAEQVIELPRPVPIYLTYLTVDPTRNGVIFRPDPYGFDALAMPQMFDGQARTAANDADRRAPRRKSAES